ncbi:hypothetical protein ACM26W_12700 [Halomonas sp. HK25]
MDWSAGQALAPGSISGVPPTADILSGKDNHPKCDMKHPLG